MKKPSGWTSDEFGPRHRVTGARNMRQHKEFQRLRAEGWAQANRDEALERALDAVAVNAEASAAGVATAVSKSAKRKQRRKKSRTAQHGQYMAGRLAELQDKFGVDYGG